MSHSIFFKTLTCSLVVVLSSLLSYSQDKKQAPPATQGSAPAPAPPKPGPKPYKEIITDKARTDSGFFTVHKVEEKYFFEIPDSLIGREWLVIVRVGKTTNGIGYGGEEQNHQTLRWEKAPDNKILLRVVSNINVATDDQPISRAVRASNTEAIAASFDIKAFSKDSAGVVIDITDFVKGESAVVTFQPDFKRAFGLTGMIPDRSFINYIKSFPKNTEIRTTKTFATAPAPSPFLNITDAGNVGFVTLELNTSLVMLPKIPMKRRFQDERVGYFTTGYTNYGLDAHRTESETFITRWRLEPKPGDIQKMKTGELVEPANPIVYYIDPATPKKWVKYLKMGIEDWNIAFEKAGFKNAIQAKDFPENDSTVSPEDVRFSMIRYFASDIPNAYGPQTIDPRSGEVIQSQVGWYHNVMQILRDWYLIQAAAVDPGARKVKFDDELMGELIRFVSSHEIGHTLGLAHNFGASSTVPVEKLRDKAWVEANGHTPSIMDYARFNYVAQPEDNIGRKGLFPRINDYDIWAIEFGYKPVFDKNEYEEKPIMNDLVKERLKNKRLIYLRQRSPAIFPAFPDPRAQNEDLGDNAMLASEYGIKNLKRILPNLPEWMKEDGKQFEQLDEVYESLAGQFSRYVWHVTANIGGIYENLKTSDQEGPEVFTPVPKKIQRDAMDFLKKNIFTTPAWLIDFKILKQFNQDQVVDEIRSMEDGFMNDLLNTGRFARMIDNTAMLGNETYTLDELVSDIRKYSWSELYDRKTPDWYKRNMQKIFVEKICGIIQNPATLNFPPGAGKDNPRRFYSKYLAGQMDVKKSDVLSVLKGALRTLRADITAALPTVKDNMTRYHYQDVLDRIKQQLDPK